MHEPGTDRKELKTKACPECGPRPDRVPSGRILIQTEGCMRHDALRSFLSVGSVALLLTACDTPGHVAEPPRLAASSSSALADARGGAVHPIEMLDQCDPATFNAAIGPGTCTSSHSGIKFDKFIGQLISTGNAPAWRNSPSTFTAAFGTQLVAVNRGGEVHTFTRVAEFGGGVVPVLNDILGLTPRPECLAAPPEEYLPPGGTDAEAITTHGTALYQCCIHPWMKTTITVH